MNRDKYVALDVDSANIVAGVYDHNGKSVMEAHIRTDKKAIMEFMSGLSGRLHVTFEEGTQAAWLYDVILPLASEVIVCNPRRNKLIQSGSKSDRIDVAKLGKLLRLGELTPVYHGEQSILGLKHLVHAYERLSSDATRTKNRLKAVFRSRGIGCRGRAVYEKSKQDEWVKKLEIEGLQTRAELLYRELELQDKLKEEAVKKVCKEARRHPAYKLIRQLPGVGPVRAAQIIEATGSPHRFRTKRQYWPYCGLAVVTHSSADYEWKGEKTQKRKKPVQTRGLNRNFNRTLKGAFKGAAITAIKTDEEFKKYYQRMIDNRMRPEMALLNVARKLAAITLAVWKKGEAFDPKRVNQAARTDIQ
jgi:transposase